VSRAAVTDASAARILWAAALGLALALHAVWLLPFRPMRPGFDGVVQPRPALVRFAPVAADAAAVDARWLWAPVNFSPPAAAGLGLAGPGGGVLQPPMRLPEEPPPLRVRAAPTPTPAVYAPAGVAPAAWPLIDRAAPPPPAGSSMIALNADAGAWPFPLDARAAGGAPWQAVVRVAFGADGLPRSALVEEGDAPPAVRVEIARALFAWRPEDIEPGRTLRLRLRHVPPAGEGAP
jgi:hypothetical protein